MLPEAFQAAVNDDDLDKYDYGFFLFCRCFASLIFLLFESTLVLFRSYVIIKLSIHCQEFSLRKKDHAQKRPIWRFEDLT